MITIVRKYLPAIATLLLSAHALAQPCPSSARIQTSVVEKPAEAQTSVLNCKAIALKWKGSPNQSYILNCYYSDNTSITETLIDCDGNGNCSAAIPLKAGTTLNWDIQAVQTVDGRTFYSYPLRGEYSGCEESKIVDVKANAGTIAGSNSTAAARTRPSSFMVYPNPVTGELTLKWSSDYKGNARLTIMDASGRIVKGLDLSKQLIDHMDRISVGTLAPGLYFMHLKMQDGKSISTSFVKN